MSRQAPRTIVESVQHYARTRGDQLAFAFLTDGAEITASLTYAELDARARAIASMLAGPSGGAGERALLVFEQGLDFIAAMLGCLYAGMIGVPVPAPEASRLKSGVSRLNSVLKDCQPRFLLGNARTHELLRQSPPEDSAIAGTEMIDIAAAGNETAMGRELTLPDLDSIAYLQYTSGSTSSPRGVMMTHANVAWHLAALREHLQFGEGSVSMGWLPHFHDYGLIQGILMPLSGGSPAYLMSPFSFLKRPVAWLEGISRYRVTHTFAFNFAYRFAAKRTLASQKAGLDLTCLKHAGNGGEPVHPDTSREFHAAFQDAGLSLDALAPVFGLAEATLLVTSNTAAHPVTAFDAAAMAAGRLELATAAQPAALAVGCGTALPMTTVAIVDPESLRRCAPNELGEVWVSSPGVANGYWQQPEESEGVFRARIDGETDGVTYLRTGDLGFLHEGHLYISGRHKDLIIIRGGNLYPQDVEWTAQTSHPALRADNGAAFSITEAGEERLCLVQEIERAQYTAEELEAIATAIAKAIADTHGVTLHALCLINRASIPKTTSGKIQRRACRQGFLDGSLKEVYRWTAGAPAPAMRAEVKPTQPAAPAPHTASSERTDQLISWVRDYAERRINSRLIDERRCLTPNIVLDFGNRGVFGLQSPERYGGLALGHWDTLRFYVQLAAADPTLATLVFLHNTNGTRPILFHARDGVRDQLMPLLATGRTLAGFALSEPGAGSNLAEVTGHAKPDGSRHWRLNAEKRWNGTAWTGVMSVFVRLLDAAGKPRGLTGFVVRQDEPGIEIGPESLTMGVRGIMQNSVRLAGVRVNEDRLLGELGGGMQIAEDVLSHGRLATASVGLGAGMRAMQLALRYVRDRQVESGRLLDNPQTRLRMNEALMRLAAGRALLEFWGRDLDQGSAIVPEAAMAVKVLLTEAGFAATDLAMQLLGGRGYMENNIIPQLFRDARMLTIGEGANEGLAAALGRSLRLSAAIPSSLQRMRPDGRLAERLVRLSATLESRDEGLERTARIWADAARGQAAVAAFEWAGASLTGSPAAEEWAAARFEELARRIEAGPPAIAEASGIEERINAMRGVIGDLEPMAPEVDLALDPLLKRRSIAAPAEPRAPLSAEEKRALLRRLLEQEKSLEQKGGVAQ